MNAYFQDGDDDWAKNGKPMCSSQSIPYSIVLFEGHPAGCYKKVEDEVHNEQDDNEVEDLHILLNTIVIERLSLRLTM